MAKKKSATQIAAELAYFKANNISFEVKPQKQGVAKVKANKQEVAPNPNGQIYGFGSAKDLGISIKLISKNRPMVQFFSDKDVITTIKNKYESLLSTINSPSFVREPYEIKRFIEKENCQEGICYFARVVYGWRISETWWVRRYSEDGFWCEIPALLYTTKELMESISLRIKNLTELLTLIE